MSAHVLLNLLNEWKKRDNLRGVSSILCLFRNGFNINKTENTGTRMLDSINHMTHHIFRAKIQDCVIFYLTL